MAPPSNEPAAKATTPDATKDDPVDDKSKSKDSAGKDKKDGPENEEELSEADQKLKDDLDMLVSRLFDSNTELHQPALEEIKVAIKTSTSSMTAVPAPLKFLRPHYTALADLFEKWTTTVPEPLVWSLADALSVVGMTSSEGDNRDTLKYRLLSPSSDIDSWGHEYVRHLSLQIGQEYHSREEELHKDDLIELAKSLVPYFLKNNAEPDAVDLLSELDIIEEIKDEIDEKNYSRVCLYMLSMVTLLPYPDDDRFLRTTYDIYMQYNQHTRAMVIAIRLNDEDLLSHTFRSTDDRAVRRQMAFLLARQRTPFIFTDEELNEDSQLADCYENSKLSELFAKLAEELDILSPKAPADIYKDHLQPHSVLLSVAQTKDESLADSFVNGLVNAGFGSKDNIPKDTNSSKKHVDLCISASYGLINLWDKDGSGIDEISDLATAHENNDSFRAGYSLALGLLHSNVIAPEGAVQVLLKDQHQDSEKSMDVRCATIMSLGVALAGTCDSYYLQDLVCLVIDPSDGIQVSAMAVVALGLIFVGSANQAIYDPIFTVFTNESPDRMSQLSDKWMSFIALGFGLLFLGQQEGVDDALKTLAGYDHKFAKPMAIFAESCAWAGSGNVLKIQQLLQICTEASTKETDDEEEENRYDSLTQSFAVLGMALIAMGEEIGQEMYIRQLGHLMHYGTPAIRKAVPLALALLLPSNPQMKVYDTLSRYSHDTDNKVAINAIFAMGVVGAGTNNARLALLLRQLSTYHPRDPGSGFTFMVKFAQGLLHLGKGTISLNPFHTDRQVMSRVGVASLLAAMVPLLEDYKFVLDKSHYLLYYIVPAMYPRFLFTLDEDLKPLKVNVRVGQAVDVAGQAGQPKTITGWQTQSTPVLLAHGERAELEDEKYLSLSGALEGIVILRKNPDWHE